MAKSPTFWHKQAPSEALAKHMDRMTVRDAKTKARLAGGSTPKSLDRVTAARVSRRAGK